MTKTTDAYKHIADKHKQSLSKLARGPYFIMLQKFREDNDGFSIIIEQFYTLDKPRIVDIVDTYVEAQKIVRDLRNKYTQGCRAYIQ